MLIVLWYVVFGTCKIELDDISNTQLIIIIIIIIINNNNNNNNNNGLYFSDKNTYQMLHKFKLKIPKECAKRKYIDYINSLRFFGT